MRSLFSHVWLWNCSLPGSPIFGILQARILEWVAMPSSRGSCWSKDQTCVSTSPALASRFFTTEPPGKPPLPIDWLVFLQICLCSSCSLKDWYVSHYRPPKNMLLKCWTKFRKQTSCSGQNFLNKKFIKEKKDIFAYINLLKTVYVFFHSKDIE